MTIKVKGTGIASTSEFLGLCIGGQEIGRIISTMVDEAKVMDSNTDFWAEFEFTMKLVSPEVSVEKEDDHEAV